MAAASTGRRILLIDDDEMFALAMARLLEHAGYTVRCAEDGAQGLRMAAEEPPDAILLDFMMPVQDGFAVCRQLHEMPGLAQVPVIALTAFGRDIGLIYGLRAEQAASHIRDFLEKPVEPNVLLERLGQALAGKSCAP